jgi:uncharacterized protein (DUF433 family)
MGRTLDQVLAKLPAVRRAKVEARVAEIIAEEESLQDLRKAMNRANSVGLAIRQHERIIRDPQVMLGKPVIRGTRITVEHVLRELGGGLTPEQIVAGHPHLTLEDIRAAQAYAADYI